MLLIIFSYGDTAPRSVPARVYSIFWMLLGMVAFSILTANITSSLTHKLETDLNLFGKRVIQLTYGLCSNVRENDRGENIGKLLHAQS